MKRRAVGFLTTIALATLTLVACEPECGPTEDCAEATINVVLASAVELPPAITTVVARIEEGASPMREVPLTIAANRLSASGTLTVLAGPVAFQFVALDASDVVIFASAAFDLTLTAGEVVSFTPVMACVHASCESGAGIGALEPTAFFPMPEAEVNNSIATANPVTTNLFQGVTYAHANGVIGVPGDADYFSFTVPAGNDIVIATLAERTGIAGAVDTQLFLYDASGTLVASNDQGTFSGFGSTTDSVLYYSNAPAGIYYVAVRGAESSVGRYTVEVNHLP